MSEKNDVREAGDERGDAGGGRVAVAVAGAATSLAGNISPAVSPINCGGPQSTAPVCASYGTYTQPRHIATTPITARSTSTMLATPDSSEWKRMEQQLIQLSINTDSDDEGKISAAESRDTFATTTPPGFTATTACGGVAKPTMRRLFTDLPPRTNASELSNASLHPPSLERSLTFGPGAFSASDEAGIWRRCLSSEAAAHSRQPPGFGSPPVTFSRRAYIPPPILASINQKIRSMPPPPSIANQDQRQTAPQNLGSWACRPPFGSSHSTSYLPDAQSNIARLAMADFHVGRSPSKLTHSNNWPATRPIRQTTTSLHMPEPPTYVGPGSAHHGQGIEPSRYIVVANADSSYLAHLECDAAVYAVQRSAKPNIAHIAVIAYYDLRQAASSLNRIKMVASISANYNPNRPAMEASYASLEMLECFAQEGRHRASMTSDMERPTSQLIAPSDGWIDITGFDALFDMNAFIGGLRTAAGIKTSEITLDGNDMAPTPTLIMEFYDYRDAEITSRHINGSICQGYRLNVRVRPSKHMLWLATFGTAANGQPLPSATSYSRPALMRSQTTPELAATSTMMRYPPSAWQPQASSAASSTLPRQAANPALDTQFYVREQQRLIEADKSALQKHQVPLGSEINVWRIGQGMDRRTTCMLRNIPNKYSQQMVLDILNSTHAGRYDFVYLRMDFVNRCNVGYAFVNFVNPTDIISFAQKHVGKRWGAFGSDKVCRLSYATIQGRVALVDKFRNSSVMERDPSYRPKLFYISGPQRGSEEPFPGPTHGGDALLVKRGSSEEADGSTGVLGDQGEGFAAKK